MNSMNTLKHKIEEDILYGLDFNVIAQKYRVPEDLVLTIAEQLGESHAS